jgi:hypothetical protein
MPISDSFILNLAQTANDIADDGTAGSALLVRKEVYNLPSHLHMDPK